MITENTNIETLITTPVHIKKYANRRLYNVETSSYITLQNIYDLLKDGQDIHVTDVVTNKDITGLILMQILTERELQQKPILPTSFLKNIIHLHNSSMAPLIPAYLKQSMKAFSQNQDQINQHLQNAFEDISPLKSKEK